jgi:micrococcal nuclease
MLPGDRMEFFVLLFFGFFIAALLPRRRYRRRPRLFRKRFRAGPPQAVVVRQKTTVVEDQNTCQPNVAVSHSAQIRIVEVRELGGRAWVIDGDTIDISGTRIRLAGIDAPEMDQPYGKKAKWTLVNLCKGHTVLAVFDEEQSHGRTVATCYLPDGRDLSAEMVKVGMAIDWPKFSRGKYSGLELPGIRRKLWRCDARQKGLMPPGLPD